MFKENLFLNRHTIPFINIIQQKYLKNYIFTIIIIYWKKIHKRFACTATLFIKPLSSLFLLTRRILQGYTGMYWECKNAPCIFWSEYYNPDYISITWIFYMKEGICFCGNLLINIYYLFLSKCLKRKWNKVFYCYLWCKIN